MQDTKLKMPLGLRPDKSKVVLHTIVDQKNIVARLDPNYPIAWQEKPMVDLLAKLSETVMVLVDCGKRHWMIRNHGVQEVRMVDSDDQGTEVFQGLV